MYILKNAFISITRNKGRNILIGIIILVIACCSTITLAIKNTSTSLINSYKDAYEVEATIGFNRQNMKDKFDFTNQDGMNDMKENFDNMSSLTVDEVKEYADSNYVLDYYYTVSSNVEAFDSIDAVVDYKVVLELLLIGISLTLVSSISSMISIQKFSPLQILKERS